MNETTAAPLLHDRTKQSLLQLTTRTPHALLIEGAIGSNYAEVGSWAMQQIENNHNLRPGSVLIIDNDEASITIEDVRRVIAFTKHKSVTDNDVDRLVLIQGGHKMTREAQNAILKILEEPPLGTTIIITSHEKQLMETIMSRLQVCTIHPVSLDAALSYFDKEATVIKRAHVLSGGNVHDLSSILDSDVDQVTDHAKQIVSASVYERLLMINELTKDKAYLHKVLMRINVTYSVLLEQAVTRGNDKMARALINKDKQVRFALNELPKNTNAKLILTNLFINL